MAVNKEQLRIQMVQSGSKTKTGHPIDSLFELQQL
jgi:hypothetical protein